MDTLEKNTKACVRKSVPYTRISPQIASTFLLSAKFPCSGTQYVLVFNMRQSLELSHTPFRASSPSRIHFSGRTCHAIKIFAHRMGPSTFIARDLEILRRGGIKQRKEEEKFIQSTGPYSSGFIII